MTAEYGMHLGQFAWVCPQCAALVYLSDEAKAGHDAFHAALTERLSIQPDPAYHSGSSVRPTGGAEA